MKRTYKYENIITDGRYGMKISIIGSFRKYYKEITELILMFNKNNIKVLSPKLSKITHSIEDFVIFATDDQSLTPAQIQTDTLNKILKSDIVYVYNPNGYIGRTTCFEIGVLRTTTIPLYFLEKPKDLPINIDENSIISPSKLIYSILNKMQNVELFRVMPEKCKIKNEMRLKNVVLCGSMVFYEKMLQISEHLKREGVATVIPKEESVEKGTLSEEEFSDFKRRVSNQYLAKIRDSSTYAILVLNEEKRGISNYIGANTLVEISMAFCWGRPIYLLNDLYDPLIDELRAWNAICLKGKLEKLIDNYKNERYRLEDKNDLSSEIKGQLELGDLDEYFYPLLR